MNFTEVLKSVGLNDEQIAKIGTEMKANKIYLSSEENMDVRYNKLKLDSESKEQELTKAQALITEMQKGAKGNEELTQKIKDYEVEINKLKANNEKIRIDAQLDRELIEANVQDVDYVKFKLKEKHPDGFKLDESGHIASLKDSLDALKVQIPNQFKSTEKKVEEKKLPEDNKQTGVSVEEFKKMGYRQRAELAEKDAESYKSLVEQTTK